MTPGIGPRKATQLLERFGSAEAVFHALRSELSELRLRPESIQSIIAREFHDAAAGELAEVRRIGGDIIVIDDGWYPELLREIADPPIVLYVCGNWKGCLQAPSVAIVGSRRCTTYGRNAAEMIARDLASNGICVVSGFARGIDSSAHRGALAAGGKTIAVFGTGIDRRYPEENARLAGEILDKGGCIVSQFPLGTPPLAENFPYRNRIISGLSLGVVVAEASERSGSLITARLAMEQNREVLAVPGNITSRNSFGTNYLIKSGAKLVQQWHDVAAELPPEVADAFNLDEAERGGKAVDPRVRALSRQERNVYKRLSADDTTHIDRLIEETGLSFGKLSSVLLGLEMKDLVSVHPGHNYARKL